MQGIRFRKYIRQQFFDLRLFAADMASSLQNDGCCSVNASLIEECFETAQVLGWAEDGVRYDTETLDGCFGLYSHALGLIGSKVYAADDRFESEFFKDDAWVNDQWPTVGPVIDHLNAQIVEGLSKADLDHNDTSTEMDSAWGKVQNFIEQALAHPMPTNSASALIYRIH
jgi:hypothetical protein